MIPSTITKEKGNGVIILAKNGFQTVPILSKLHTNNMCAALLQKKIEWDGQRIYKVIIIALYAKHGKQREIMEDLKFLMKNIHQYYVGIEIVVAGDLNTDMENAMKLEDEINLKMLGKDQDMVTRTQGKQNSRLDFIYSNRHCKSIQATQ